MCTNNTFDLLLTKVYYYSIDSSKEDIMKSKTLAKLLGITSRYSYESDLYTNTNSATKSKDYLQENKVATSQGHLE